MPGDGVQVTYELKDVLERMDARLATIDHKLDQKANVRDVEALERKVLELEKRFDERDAIERERARSSSTTFTRRERIITFVFMAIGVVVQLLIHFWGGKH